MGTVTQESKLTANVSTEVVRTTRTVLSVDAMPLQSVLSGENTQILVDHDVSSDDAIIMGLGYKPEFKRDFNLLTTFGVSFSVLGLLPSIASTLWYSLAYAGNAGLTWGYLIAMTGIMTVALSMGEISSAFPTSGGLYYATAMLAPPKYKAILSWIVGWSNYFVQVTGAPSVAYGGASMILALASISYPSYVQETWHCFLLTVLLTFLSAVVASAPTKWLACIDALSTALNLIFLFISFVVILGGNNRTEQDLSKFNSNGVAWAIDNQTDWPDGICIIMTFLAAVWTMSGYDSPFHLAEECGNAQVATPRAIVLTASVGGALGFIFQLAMAYTIVDVYAAVNDESGQPYIAFLAQIMTQERVLLLGTFAAILAFSMSFSCMIAASRVLFSYSRDNCFPLSRYWCKVSPMTKTPINAVWCNWVIGVLLNLLMFGGVAIDAIFSVGAIGSFISFTVPTLLRITVSRKSFKPGPWNLGRFSTPLGIYSCAFVLLIIPTVCFPQYRGSDNTPDLMNWTVLVYWASMFIVVLWFYVYAHKIYSGPKTNLDKNTVVSGEEASLVIEAVEEENHDVHFGPKGTTKV